LTEPEARHALAITPTARRQLAEHLPETVAASAYKLIVGPLLDDSHRVGKQLRPLLNDRHTARRGTYRVIYRIDDHSRIGHRGRPGASPRRLPTVTVGFDGCGATSQSRAIPEGR
jgi:mRNA interferase RelE/StbE